MANFKSILMCALGMLVLTIGVGAQTRVANSKLIEPYTLREDFQGDSLGQWASYPPAQDVGYEPSLSPTSQFEAPGGRSLMRMVKPNIPGALRSGFIRKIRIVVNEGAMINFAYRINTPNTSTQMEVGLAGANGALYTRKLNAELNRWTTADVRFSE